MSQTRASIFESDGIPAFSKALPLALQHVVAMIVGCVTPAILISDVAGLNERDRVILVQAALFVSAISTLLQLFPVFNGKKFQLGSRLPVIMGISFAYVPSMQAIAESYDVGTILGAQVIGGIVAILVGFTIRKIRVLFPPIVTGTVVFTIGLSLYPTAVKYMAGGASSPEYGSWKNWLVAFFTLAVVVGLNHFAKGTLKLASILIGIIAGYAAAACFGLVDFSDVSSAGFFQLPKPLHFCLHFEPSACVAIGILFGINSIQAIGSYCHHGRQYEPGTKDKGTPGRYFNVRYQQHCRRALWRTSNSHLQSECGHCHNDKGHQPLCAWSGRCYPYGCRICAQVFSPSDYHSPVCSGRCNDFCLCFHCHDRNQADYASGNEFPKFFYCRSFRSSGYGYHTGIGFSGFLSCMGNHYFRKISGSCSHSGSHTFKHHSSQRRTCILKTFLKRGTAISAHAPFVYLYPIFCLLCVLFYSPYLRPGIPIC